MRISALPGVPAPFKKVAAEKTYTPYTIDTPWSMPWGKLFGFGLGGGLGTYGSLKALQNLGSRLPSSVAKISPTTISSILSTLPSVAAGGKALPKLQEALKTQLAGYKLHPPKLLGQLAGAGAKMPAEQTILEHLLKAPLLRGKAGKPIAEYAASEVAKHFKPKKLGMAGAYRAIPGKGTLPWTKTPAGRVLSKPGRKSLLAIIPLLLGTAGSLLF